MAEAKKDVTAKAGEVKEMAKAEAKAEKKEAAEKKTEAKAEKKEAKVDKKDKKSKKEEKVDIVSENVYNVPLRSVYRTNPQYKRANKAVAVLQKFLVRHLKAKEVKFSSGLNEHIWARGDHKPPRMVQIKAVKDSNGRVTASLVK